MSDSLVGSLVIFKDVNGIKCVAYVERQGSALGVRVLVPSYSVLYSKLHLINYGDTIDRHVAPELTSDYVKTYHGLNDDDDIAALALEFRLGNKGKKSAALIHIVNETLFNHIRSANGDIEFVSEQSTEGFGAVFDYEHKVKEYALDMLRKENKCFAVITFGDRMIYVKRTVKENVEFI